MPTIFSHAVAGVALLGAFPEKTVPRRWAIVGAACSIVPDIDVAGFRFGIHYGDLLGHRGLSHSLIFAAGLALVATLLFSRWTPGAHRGLVWLYLFVATVSHPLLDACTNGGLGVGFFSPFDTTRYFFSWTPIQVSPIGARFFSERGVAVLTSELLWVWLPFLAFGLCSWVARRFLSRGNRSASAAG